MVTGEEESTECTCNHLTNFAVFMQVDHVQVGVAIPRLHFTLGGAE